jgi:hypothetical protein
MPQSGKFIQRQGITPPGLLIRRPGVSVVHNKPFLSFVWPNYIKNIKKDCA